jgi:hypothetical protein
VDWSAEKGNLLILPARRGPLALCAGRAVPSGLESKDAIRPGISMKELPDHPPLRMMSNQPALKPAMPKS